MVNFSGLLYLVVIPCIIPRNIIPVDTRIPVNNSYMFCFVDPRSKSWCDDPIQRHGCCIDENSTWGRHPWTIQVTFDGMMETYRGQLLTMLVTLDFWYALFFFLFQKWTRPCFGWYHSCCHSVPCIREDKSLPGWARYYSQQKFFHIEMYLDDHGCYLSCNSAYDSIIFSQITLPLKH